MGKKSAIQLILHVPQTETGRQESAHRTAQIHADAIVKRINALNCPQEQKLRLLNTFIEDAKQHMFSAKQNNYIVLRNLLISYGNTFFSQQ